MYLMKDGKLIRATVATVSPALAQCLADEKIVLPVKGTITATGIAQGRASPDDYGRAHITRELLATLKDRGLQLKETARNILLGKALSAYRAAQGQGEHWRIIVEAELALIPGLQRLTDRILPITLPCPDNGYLARLERFLGGLAQGRDDDGQAIAVVTLQHGKYRIRHRKDGAIKVRGEWRINGIFVQSGHYWQERTGHFIRVPRTYDMASIRKSIRAL